MAHEKLFETWRGVLPAMTPWRHGYQYADERKRWEQGDIATVTAEQKNQLFSEIAAHHYDMKVDLSQDKVEALWAQFSELLDNPALYDFCFVKDVEAYEVLEPGSEHDRRHLASEFFIPWRLEVPKSIALEMAYGFGYDLAGNYRRVPETDPFFYYVTMDPLFDSIRERGYQTVEWLEEMDPENIGYIAAGRLPELMHLGYRLRPGQKLFAVDSDQTINVRELMEYLGPEAQQIDYLQEDFAVGLADPRMFGVDAMLATGIATYLWDDGRFSKILYAAKQLVRPGGCLIVDLNPRHWVWPRNNAILGWPVDGFALPGGKEPMKYFDTPAQAKDELWKKAKAVGAQGLEDIVKYDENNLPTICCYRIFF